MVSLGVKPLALGKEEAKERHSEGAVKVGSFPPDPPSYSNQGFRSSHQLWMPVR